MYAEPLVVFRRKLKRAAERYGPVPSAVPDPTDTRPVLAVDVDGVISLFGFDGPIEDLGGRFHLIDGMAHCISDRAGRELAASRRGL